MDIAKELQVSVRSVYNYLRQDAQDLEDKDRRAASALYHRDGLSTGVQVKLFGGTLSLQGLDGIPGPPPEDVQRTRMGEL